jgi:peptidoglycan/xylan/chitin deacetylase (PgdA/CDA1 family)
VKQLLQQIAATTVEGATRIGLMRALERSDSDRPGQLRVLMYHRVCEPDEHPELYPGLISASPHAFAAQIEWLAGHYRIVSASDVLAALRGVQPLAPRSLLLTFDDGYVDFRDHAWPTLRRCALPVTLFVPTAFSDAADRPFWWDRLHHALQTSDRERIATPAERLSLATPALRQTAFARLRRQIKALPHDEAMARVDDLCEALGADAPAAATLDWSALRTLVEEGVTLCPHTRTHPLLDRIPVERVRSEVRGSLRDLEKNVGPTLPIFAYPSGAFDANALRVLKEEGFEAAFTTQRGISELGVDDPLRLPRIPVGSRTTLPLLRLQLLARTAQLVRLHPG